MQRTFDKWTSNAWGGLQTISRVEADAKNAEWEREQGAEDDDQGEQRDDPGVRTRGLEAVGRA